MVLLPLLVIILLAMAVLLRLGGITGTDTAWLIVLVCAFAASVVGAGPIAWPWTRR
jgi:hypothetical protein